MKQSIEKTRVSLVLGFHRPVLPFITAIMADFSALAKSIQLVIEQQLSAIISDSISRQIHEILPTATHDVRSAMFQKEIPISDNSTRISPGCDNKTRLDGQDDQRVSGGLQYSAPNQVTHTVTDNRSSGEIDIPLQASQRTDRVSYRQVLSPLLSEGDHKDMVAQKK